MDEWEVQDEMVDKIDDLKVENAKLQELLRGTGANRYWEGRWRDADNENTKLRAALEAIAYWGPVSTDGKPVMPMQEMARRALENEKWNN